MWIEKVDLELDRTLAAATESGSSMMSGWAPVVAPGSGSSRPAGKLRRPVSLGPMLPSRGLATGYLLEIARWVNTEGFQGQDQVGGWMAGG